MVYNKNMSNNSEEQELGNYSYSEKKVIGRRYSCHVRIDTKSDKDTFQIGLRISMKGKMLEAMGKEVYELMARKVMDDLIEIVTDQEE